MLPSHRSISRHPWCVYFWPHMVVKVSPSKRNRGTDLVSWFAQGGWETQLWKLCVCVIILNKIAKILCQNKPQDSLPTHVLPMWAYVHGDPMGSWQMAGRCHTQMPTSYLSHLCQDKTHETGLNSTAGCIESEEKCRRYEKHTGVSLISKNSYCQHFHVWQISQYCLWEWMYCNKL